MTAIGGEADGPRSGAIDTIRDASGRPGLLAAWLVLVLALSGPALSAFQSAVVAPLASSIAQHFGGGHHGAFIAQLTLVLPAAGVIVGGPLTGRLLERFGYRPVIVGNALLLAIAGSAGAWLDDMAPFLMMRLLVGLSSVMLYSALVALTGLLFRGVTLARMISYQSGIAALLGMGLMLVSGPVASHSGWRASFLIYLATAAFALVALSAWLPPPVPGAKRTARGSLRPVLPILLVAILSFIPVYLVVIQGSLLMSDNGIGDPSTQAMVIAAASLANAIFATACSWIERHVFGRALFAAALALMGAGALIMGAVPAIWGVALGAVLIGAGAGLTVSYMVRMIVERAPADSRQRAAGLIAPSFYIAQAANPLLMQPLRMAIGTPAAFIFIGLLLFLAAGIAMAWRARGDAVQQIPSSRSAW